ncbi:MAG: acetyl-CoA carboxylase biotin carboxyl carrier protein subunit [Cyclobacteriaceae bacterium]|nr:acetyl-CoA carboxylase biotin carboxyl carrier protein subunit [Cyclobacteriaceae bacterium]
MQQVTIGTHTFEFTSSEGVTYVDGQPLKWDLIRVDEDHYHILHNHKSYRAELVKIDAFSKTVTLKINGNNHSVKLKDKFDLLLEKMGIAATNSNKLSHIKAPMPGLIIDMKVKAGDEVKTGDALLILEAMKMENILKSPGDGTVKNVTVKKGDSVEKGHILVEF